MIRYLKIFSPAIFLISLWTSQSLAQVEVSPSTPSTKKDDDENIIKLKRDTDQQSEIKVFSEADRRRVCAKYNGKYISVYGDVYKVDRCIRRPIVDADLLFRIQRTGVQFIEVESTEVAPIQVGSVMNSLSPVAKRSCKELNGKYITQSYADIYYVENCAKRLIPDYETLVDFRRLKGHSASTEVTALSPEEFDSLKVGRDFPSVVDKKEFAEHPAKKGVDIIPIDEACKKVEGKTVSYYSRLYKIEKCKKRELDAEVYSKNFLKNPQKLVELTPEQWISIPDGKPIAK